MKRIVPYPSLVSEPVQQTRSTVLFNELSTLPFWCGDNHTDQDRFCCLTHVVGLPRHPATNQQLPLTPYQVDFFQRVNDAKQPKDGMSILENLRLPHKFHLLKGRQMGFTEIVLRVIQYYCLHDYAGKKVGIMAATNGALAAKDLRRFARLFRDIPGVIDTWVKNNKMILANGTTIEAFKADQESMTGDTGYKCVMLDEAAKWRLIDDTPVFNSVMPIVNTNGSDLFLVSTPKGRVKMFYNIWKDPQDFNMLEYDIWRAKDNLYTAEQIQHMIDHSKEDPDQEYLCKFTMGRDAVFPEITDEMRDENEYEWNYDPENDSFKEPADFRLDDLDDPDFEWRPGRSK